MEINDHNIIRGYHDSFSTGYGITGQREADTSLLVVEFFAAIAEGVAAHA